MADTVNGQPACCSPCCTAPRSRSPARLRHLLEGVPPWGAIDPAAIPWVEQQTGRTLAPSQRVAVAQVLTGKVTVITGGPGVGKTTIVTSILQALRAKRMRVLLCAPTARRQTPQ